MVNIENKVSASALTKSGALILVCLLSGCALFPPPPAECQGQYRPVNATPEKNADVDKSVSDSNAANESVGLDKTSGASEGAADGK